MGTTGTYVDLTGSTYGALYVKERDYSFTSKVMWTCVCKCGNTKIVSSSYLHKVKYPSCGCSHRKLNTYIQKEGYCELILSNNKGVAKVSNCDIEKIHEYTWQLSLSGYIVTTIRENNKQRVIFLHRLIMSVHNQKFKHGITIEVDHINHDKLDCRRENLRFATRQQNNSNSSIRARNKTGYKGVFKYSDKYRAKIRLNKKDIHLGVFDTPEEAGEAYNQAALKYHREYASLNTIKGV